MILFLFLACLPPLGSRAAAPYLGKDVYEIFKVSRQDPDPEAAFKKGYRALVMKYHPDRNPGNAQAEETIRYVNGLMDKVRKEDFYKRFAPKVAKPAPPPPPPPPPSPPPRAEAPRPEPPKPSRPGPPPPPPPPPGDVAAAYDKVVREASAAARAYSRTASEGAHVSGGTGGNYYPYEGQYEKSKNAAEARAKPTAPNPPPGRENCQSWFASLFDN